MKRSQFVPAVAATLLAAGSLTAQITPQFIYSGSAGGSINIFNDSKVFVVTGRQNDSKSVQGATSFSHNVTALGSASAQRYGGAGAFPFSMQVTSQASGVVGYGRIVFAGSAKVTSEGQHFTNASATQPQTVYETDQAEAEARLSLIYNDVIHVESATLPPGTAVVVRASMDCYASAPEYTTTSPVLFSYPPTGPGFPPPRVMSWSQPSARTRDGSADKPDSPPCRRVPPFPQSMTGSSTPSPPALMPST